MTDQSYQAKYDSDESWESKLFGALSIIVIGITLFLNTTGVLPWSFWVKFFSYWPLFLVYAGISIIFSGTRLLKFIGSVLGFLLLLGMLYLAGNSSISARFLPNIETGVEAKNSELIVPESKYSNVELREINAEIPFGETTLKSDDRSSDYLKISSKYYQSETNIFPDEEFENQKLTINLKPQQVMGFMGVGQSPEYLLELGKTDLLTDLNLKFGAGNGVLELRKFNVNNVNLEMGTGNLEVSLGSDSIPSGVFNLKNGLGNIELDLSDTKDIGVRIVYKVGLGNVNVDGRSISSGANNSFYETDGYENKSEKLIINVDLGLGNLEIKF